MLICDRAGATLRGFTPQSGRDKQKFEGLRIQAAATGSFLETANALAQFGQTGDYIRAEMEEKEPATRHGKQQQPCGNSDGAAFS